MHEHFKHAFVTMIIERGNREHLINYPKVPVISAISRILYAIMFPGLLELVRPLLAAHQDGICTLLFDRYKSLNTC